MQNLILKIKNNNPPKWGSWLVALLKSQGISQRELARRLGTKSTTVNRWCSLDRMAGVQKRYVLRLCEELGIDERVLPYAHLFDCSQSQNSLSIPSTDATFDSAVLFAAPRGEGTFVAWGDLVLQIQRTYGFRISGEPISAAIARLLDQGELREEHTTREHIRLVGLTPTGRQRRDNLESTTPMRDTA